MNRFSLLVASFVLLVAALAFTGYIDESSAALLAGVFPLVPPIPKKFAADVAACRFVAATANDEEVTVANGPTAKVLGIVDEHGGTSGQSGAVHVYGVVPLEYGDDVVPGDKLRPDTTGRGIPAAAEEHFYAIAHEGGDAGTIGSAALCTGTIPAA